MASDAGGGGVGGVGGGGGPKRLALPTITTTAPGSNQEKLSIPVSSHLFTTIILMVIILMMTVLMIFCSHDFPFS